MGGGSRGVSLRHGGFDGDRKKNDPPGWIDRIGSKQKKQTLAVVVH